MSEGEVWKDVLGYEGLYKVSNKGNVFSVGRVSSQGKKCGGLTLNPRNVGAGYLQVSLYKNGKMKGEYVHRLVAEAFIPNPESLPQINHIDEVKVNNELSNLEWCTREYNNNYGTRVERFTQALSKKVRAVNVETGEVVTFNSTQEAGRKGYSNSSVSAACRGVYNTGGGNLYKGHKWYYEIMEGE